MITGMFNTFFELIIHEMPLERSKALFERNERFLYRRVDENYGAVKMNKFVRAICPIIFIHRLVTANFTRATLTEMRILEGVHFVLVS